MPYYFRNKCCLLATSTQVVPATTLLLLEENTNTQSSMRASTMSSNDHYEYLVPQEQRSLYGMRDLEACASSHPSDPSCLYEDRDPCTFTLDKNIFAIGVTDFEQKFTSIFEDKLHDNIVSGILATLPDCDFSLNVLHLGFDDKYLENLLIIKTRLLFILLWPVKPFPTMWPATLSRSSLKLSRQQALIRAR